MGPSRRRDGSLFAEGKASVVHDYVKAAHDAGVLTGVSAHNPELHQAHC